MLEHCIHSVLNYVWLCLPGAGVEAVVNGIWVNQWLIWIQFGSPIIQILSNPVSLFPCFTLWFYWLRRKEGGREVACDKDHQLECCWFLMVWGGKCKKNPEGKCWDNVYIALKSIVNFYLIYIIIKRYKSSKLCPACHDSFNKNDSHGALCFTEVTLASSDASFMC